MIVNRFSPGFCPRKWTEEREHGHPHPELLRSPDALVGILWVDFTWVLRYEWSATQGIYIWCKPYYLWVSYGISGYQLKRVIHTRRVKLFAESLHIEFALPFLECLDLEPHFRFQGHFSMRILFSTS